MVIITLSDEHAAAVLRIIREDRAVIKATATSVHLNEHERKYVGERLDEVDAILIQVEKAVNYYTT